MRVILTMITDTYTSPMKASGRKDKVRSAPTRRSSRIENIKKEKVKTGRVTKTTTHQKEPEKKKKVVKNIAKKPVAKKETVKRPAARKEVAKKPVAKKEVVKKPAAGKETVKKPAAKKEAANKSIVKKVTKKPAAKKNVKTPAAKKVAKKPAAKKVEKKRQPVKQKVESDSNSAWPHPDAHHDHKNRSGPKGFHYGPTNAQLNARIEFEKEHPGTIFCP